MATTTSLTTTYAGQVAGGYLRAAFLANDTLQNITVKENIEYKQVVRKLVDSITFAAPTCDFTPTGTVTLTERLLTLEGFQVHRQLCKKDFLTDWEARAEQNGELHTSLSDALIANMMAAIAANNERIIWQGVNATAGEYDGFETLLTADGTVNAVATPVAITKSNVVAKMELLVDACPIAVRKATEKPLIYVSSNVAESYVRAMAAAGNGFFYNAGAPISMTFNGMYNIVECPGMSSDTMVMAQPSNLWFGTNLLSQWNEVKTLDQSLVTGADTVNFVARFYAGVQYGIGSEIAYYNA
jgi:hypothetical protein